MYELGNFGVISKFLYYLFLRGFHVQVVNEEQK